MFKIAEKHGQAQQDTSFAKWKKILPIMPSNKNDTPVARGKSLEGFINFFFL